MAQLFVRFFNLNSVDIHLLMKGAIHDFITSSYTSGKKRHRSRPHPAPRNQSSSREGLGLGGLLTSTPDTHGCPGKHGCQLWVRCGGGDNTRGGQPHRTFILRGREPIPDAVIDILSTDGAPNEMLGAPWDGPAKSPGNQTGCSLHEE